MDVKYAAGTAGAKLGIVRAEARKINGLTWTFAYNAEGECTIMAPADEYATKILEKRSPESNVPIEFRDLVKVNDEGDEEIVPAALMTMDDAGFADSIDPVGEFVSKLAKDAARVPEIPARHQDGIELEKVGADTWKHTWKNGALIKSELNGVIVTDESSKPLFITDEMAKFLGYGENNQHSDVGLVGWTPGSAA